jgi:ketosteroid isomerase-like protein
MSDSENEKKAIQAVWQRAVEALATCDWPAYAELWAHDSYVAAIHPAQGSWWTGWNEVGERYRAIIEKGIPIRASTQRMDIQLSRSGDVAWAAFETEVRAGKTGGRLSWQVVVFEKKAGEWRMALAFDAPRRAKG